MPAFPDLFSALRPQPLSPPGAARPGGLPASGAAGADDRAGPHPGLPDVEQLHPALWRAHQVGGQRGGGLASGFAELDAELPGHGWPARALTELLLPHPGIGELRLLAPALATVQRGGRHVMLVDPPAMPCGWTLAALGLDLRLLVLVRGPGGARTDVRTNTRTDTPTGTLWALEQALKCGHLGAVLGWLPPRVRPESLRRLQLAAQAHDGPAFLLREASAQSRPSAAPLRLLLAPGGPDELLLGIVKRRGPPLAQPLALALMPVLPASARARALRSAAVPAGQAGHAAPLAAAGHE